MASPDAEEPYGGFEPRKGEGVSPGQPCGKPWRGQRSREVLYPGAGETVARSKAPAIGRKASRLAQVQDGNRSRYGGARGLIEPGSCPDNRHGQMQGMRQCYQEERHEGQVTAKEQDGLETVYDRSWVKL